MRFGAIAQMRGHVFTSARQNATAGLFRFTDNSGKTVKLFFCSFAGMHAAAVGQVGGGENSRKLGPGYRCISPEKHRNQCLRAGIRAGRKQGAGDLSPIGDMPRLPRY
jgi:hypothetical protein